MERIAKIILGVVFLLVGFLIGSLSRYDQIEIGKTITFTNGEIFTPDSWDNAKDESYSLLQINNVWRFFWQPKNWVKIRDGYSLIPESFYGTIRFGDGEYTLNDTLNFDGYRIIGNGRDKTIIKMEQ